MDSGSGGHSGGGHGGRDDGGSVVVTGVVMIDLISAEIRDNSEKQRKIYEYRDVHSNNEISCSWKTNENPCYGIIPKMHFQ